MKGQQTLLVEVDLNAVEPQQLQQLTQRYGIDVKRPLTQWLTPKAQQQYQDYCQLQKIACRQFAPFKPWLVGITLFSLSFAQSGFDAQLGIDRYFLSKAKGNKPILGLESIEQQFGLLANQPAAIQQELLLQSINYKTDELSELVDAWASGDEAKLVGLFNQLQDQGLEKVFRQQLLVKRNLAMAKQLMLQLKTAQSLFVVVGTAHFIGQDNILSLLQDQGVKVSRLKYAAGKADH